MKAGTYLILLGVLCLLAGLFACIAQQASPAAIDQEPTSTTQPPGEGIRGTVLDENGQPLGGANVRIQATTNSTTTDENGEFILSGLEAGKAVTVSAWAEGYYCASAVEVLPPAGDITLTMRRVQPADNPDYEWIAPTGGNSCYSCKAGVTQVWLENDAHGRSAANIHYLTMYLGTDVDGNQSPLTRYVYDKDYGYFPLHPDLTQPYYGPGYILDFPDSAGNCAACHNPGAAIDAPYATDPSTVSGADTYGIHCDYCHKVADVTLDPQSGLPYPNRPGVLSQVILRPFPEDEDRYQLFFGTFDDDNVPMEDTYLPLIEQSQWCAPCHYGLFWDTLIYNSYGEWLESSYSDPETGKTCQQCHMPSPTILDDQALTNVAPGMGGVERDPLAIHAHTFPGASNQVFLQNSVTMDVVAEHLGGTLTVAVSIVNDKTGHSIPTDSPLRQLILLVEASGSDGAALEMIEGPVLPDWTGVGEPATGHYAGLPGMAYAKILMELWTEVSPSGSYWNPTRIVSDNRIPALGTDTTRYEFALPVGSAFVVEVRLLHRRAFIDLAVQKGWTDPDILMEYLRCDEQGCDTSSP